MSLATEESKTESSKLKSTEVRRSIFEFESYREYLEHAFATRGRTHGFKRALSRICGCHPTLISQVWVGKHEFTMEQAERISRSLRLKPDEVEYFFTLISLARAGTHELRQHFVSKLRSLSQRNDSLRSRIPEEVPIKDFSDERYFSSWIYGAIHMLIALPRFQSPESLAMHLALPIGKIHEVLSYLESRNLVRSLNGSYHFVSDHIYVDQQSPYSYKHHLNWRVKAIASLEKASPDDLHFSGAFAISKKDLEKFKKTFQEAIQKNYTNLKTSAEEEVCWVALDCFKIS